MSPRNLSTLEFLNMAAVWSCCDVSKSVFKVCCRNFHRNETRMEKRPRTEAINVSPCFFLNLFIFQELDCSHRSIELDG